MYMLVYGILILYKHTAPKFFGDFATNFLSNLILRLKLDKWKIDRHIFEKILADFCSIFHDAVIK